MEKFNGTLEIPQGDENRMVEIDGKDMRLYDADTLIDDTTGQSHRIKGLDAPENPSINPLDGFTMGIFADNYSEEVKDRIENQGFNKLVDTGEKDVYGRTLSRVEDNLGRNLAYEMTKEGIFGPTQYNLDDSSMHEAWTSARFDALIGAQEQLPAWKQLEQSLYHNSVPRMGKLSWMEQRKMPSSLKPVNRAIDESFSGQAVDAAELWWYQNIGAFHGLNALMGREDAFQSMDDLNREISQEISPGTIISLEQIKDIPDTFAYIQNQLIMNLPDLAILAGGGKAGAAIGSAAGPVGAAIGGFAGSMLGLGYMWMKGTGNVAQEQYEVTGDVDPVQAITLGTIITAIDKIGASHVLKPTDFLTKQGMTKAVSDYQAHMAKQGIKMTTEQAKAAVEGAVKDNVSKLSASFAVNAADMLSKRQVALGFAGRLLKEGAQEGVTEGIQESVQYLGINGVPKTAEEWERFGMRLADAAAAGGLTGTVYHMGDTLITRNKVESLRDQVLDYDPEKSPLTEKLAIEGNKAFDHQPIETVVEQYRGAPTIGIKERNERNNKGYARRAADKLIAGNYIPGLSAIKNAIRAYLIEKSGRVNREATLLANIFGAYQTMYGNTLYNEEQTRLGNISVDFPWLNDVNTHFGLDPEQFNTMVDDLIKNNFNSNLVDPKYKAQAKQLKDDVLSMNEQLKVYMAEAGINDPMMDSLLDNPAYLFDQGLPDSKKVFDNSQKFVNQLAQHTLEGDFGSKKAGEQVGEALANEILDAIFNRDFGVTGEVVQFMKASGAAKSIKDFMNNSHIDQFKNKLLGEVTRFTRQKYLGENNEVISNLINKMVEDKVITEDQADALAADMVDQIAKHNRQFGRIQNELLANVQDIARGVTSLGVMDTVIFSQMGEAVMAFMQSDKGVVKSIGSFAADFAQSVRYSIPKIANKRGKVTDKREQYERSGYHSEELIQQQGADVNNKFIRELQQKFYIANLLEPTTDAIRMSRMGIAFDSLSQMIEEMKGVDLDKMTRKQAKMYERLAYYGGNVPELVRLYSKEGPLTPQDQETLNLIWETMVPKFVDEFTVRIKPGSRPSIFEDQRFGLPFFTQYLSFTAHYHANVLPRMYTVYLKDATAPVAYKTFQVITAAILVAYTSQFLKDLLLRGEEHPSLEGATGAIHRAINYSGALGWGQEVIDQTMGSPYGFEWEGFIDYLQGTPTLSHTGRVFDKLSEGEFSEAAARGLPFADLFQETAAPRRLIDFLTGEE